MSRLQTLSLPDLPKLPEGADRRAAVAIVVGPDDAILLIRRAEREGDLWSGHMAFPGGREDPQDASLLATALRETREEVGLDLTDARVLGALDPQLGPPRPGIPRIGVVPWVFSVERWPPLSPNDEVAAVHHLSLDRLAAGEGRGTFPYRWNDVELVLPCVRLDGTLVWGMTLRMIDDLLARAGAGR